MTHLVGKAVRIASLSVIAVLLLGVTALAAEEDMAVAIGATTGSSLRLRSGPSLDASVITMLDEDVPVAVLDDTLDGWYKINYNGNTGFVSADYMLIDQDNIFNAYGRVEGDGVNVRSSSSTDSEVLTVMNRSSIATVNGFEDGWYKITETEPAPGYSMKEPTTQEIYIKAGTSKSVTFENIPLSALVVYKYDSVTGEAVSNAVFQVKYLAGGSGTGGTVIGQKKTGLNGMCMWTGLNPGSYIVEEVDPADGYNIINSSETVYLADDGEQSVVTVRFNNSPNGSLLIRKVCATNPSVTLQNAEFKVTYADGTAFSLGREFSAQEKSPSGVRSISGRQLPPDGKSLSGGGVPPEGGSPPPSSSSSVMSSPVIGESYPSQSKGILKRILFRTRPLGRAFGWISILSTRAWTMSLSSSAGTMSSISRYALVTLRTCSAVRFSLPAL